MDALRAITNEPLLKFKGFPLDQEVIREELRVQAGPRPRFGDDHWDLWAMGLSPTSPRTKAILRFQHLPESWQLTTKLIFMTLLNPFDENLINFGFSYPQKSPKVTSLSTHYYAFKLLANWAEKNELSSDLSRWETSNIEDYLTFIKEEKAPSSLRAAERILQLLIALSPILPSSLNAPLPPTTKWSKRGITTQPLAPQDFWALLRACWSYITIFGPDLLDARDEIEHRKRKLAQLPAVTSPDEVLTALERFLRSSEGFIPLHCTNYANSQDGEINWAGLKYVVDFNTETKYPFPKEPRNRRYKKVLELRDEGCPTQFGLLRRAPRTVTRPDGSQAPWCQGFDQGFIAKELSKIRSACFIFIAALTTMRASEVLSLQAGCLTTYYGAPALKSRVIKHKDGPGEAAYWWISEPVTVAVRLLERLTPEGENLFQPIKKNYAGFDYDADCRRFVEWVNRHAFERGLEPIGDTSVRAHRLRRTMAVITAAEPDGEIALGVTLKHNATRALANSVTSGYATPTSSWAKELGIERAGAAAAELVSAWSNHVEGKSAIRGPGAATFVQSLEEVTHRQQGRPLKGDDRTLRDLLRDEFSNITLGTLNHCLGDPSIAECLKDLDEEAKKAGPIMAACSPTRCRNSVITEEHLPIWRAEEEELTKLLRDQRMSAVHRARLDFQLKEIRKIVGK